MMKKIIDGSKMQILENKLRKMVREELHKNSGLLKEESLLNGAYGKNTLYFGDSTLEFQNPLRNGKSFDVKHSGDMPSRQGNAVILKYNNEINSIIQKSEVAILNSIKNCIKELESNASYFE